MNNFETSSGSNERLGGLLLPHDTQKFTQLHGLQGLLRVMTRRLKWIILSILVCEVLAFIITKTTVPVYEATATIELNKSGGAQWTSGLGTCLSEAVRRGSRMASSSISRPRPRFFEETRWLLP